MHSKIFQITRTRVSQDDYLNESTLAQGDNSFFDYCGEIDEAERKFREAGFSRSINGCLVNLACVTKIDKDTVYIGSDALPLARMRKKEFVDDFMNFLRRKG